MAVSGRISTSFRAAGRIGFIGFIGFIGLAFAVGGCAPKAEPTSRTTERVTFAANAGADAAVRSAERYCGQLSRRSILVSQPPQSQEYVFSCY